MREIHTIRRENWLQIVKFKRIQKIWQRVLWSYKPASFRCKEEKQNKFFIVSLSTADKIEKNLKVIMKYSRKLANTYVSHGSVSHISIEFWETMWICLSSLF